MPDIANFNDYAFQAPAGYNDLNDNVRTRFLTEDQASVRVKAADRVFLRAQEEVRKRRENHLLSDPAVDVAAMVASEWIFETRKSLGDAAVKNGDRKGAINAYEEALTLYLKNPYNQASDKNAVTPAPQSIINSLTNLGVPKEEAIKESLRRPVPVNGADSLP